MAPPRSPPSGRDATPPVWRLRPVQRLRLPRTLQADRVWAFARSLEGGVASPAFGALVRRIDGSPWHAIETVSVLRDGADVVAQLLHAIAEAREEVLVETYILRDDDIGEALHRALVDAVSRGVRAHLLADSFGSVGTRRAFWRRLTDAGIAVRLFHPWWGPPWQSWRRDHRKLVVVDRRVAFTGGMNIGAEYGSSLRARHDAWRDGFVRVTGTVAAELAAVFAEGWDRAGGAALPGLAGVSWERGLGTIIGGRHFTSADDAAERTLVLDARPGRGQPETVAVLAAIVGAARARLWITTPYFAPPTGALTILADAARRGVDVRLMLPGRSDVPLLRHAAHGAYARLLREGVRIFEYQRAILHAKAMVVDDVLAVVGSANLDFRSLWFNAECNLLLHSPRVATTLAAHFTEDVAEAVEIDEAAWRARSRWHRLGDRVARALRPLL